MNRSSLLVYQSVALLHSLTVTRCRVARARERGKALGMRVTDFSFRTIKPPLQLARYLKQNTAPSFPSLIINISSPSPSPLLLAIFLQFLLLYLRAAKILGAAYRTRRNEEWVSSALTRRMRKDEGRGRNLRNHQHSACSGLSKRKTKHSVHFPFLHLPLPSPLFKVRYLHSSSTQVSPSTIVFPAASLSPHSSKWCLKFAHTLV